MKELLSAIHSATPWSNTHPFIELIQECRQRILASQELTFVSII